MNLTSIIIAFAIVTIITIALLIGIYYFYQVKNNKNPSPSSISTALIVQVIAGILSLLLWFSLIYYMIEGNGTPVHHEIHSIHPHHEMLEHRDSLEHHAVVATHVPTNTARPVPQWAPPAQHQIAPPVQQFSSPFSPSTYPGTVMARPIVAN